MRRALAILLLAAAPACFSNEPRISPERLRTVPDVVGRSVADARRTLESQGYGVETDQSCAGAVSAEDPPSGTGVLRASTITLTVACR